VRRGQACTTSTLARYGHTGVGDDVAEVGDRRRAEGALALLDSDLVLS
jgi:hypothetical protein